MFKLNQKGLAHIFLILILGAGIIAGVYVVQHTQIFSPKAYFTNLPFNQYDEPPALIISNSDSAQSVLQDVGKAGDYSIALTNTEDEITLDFEPQELTEEEAKQMLNSSDIYYLRTIMWILLDSFNKIPGPSIDPWYALCDHLSEDVLAKVGPEPTLLASGEYLNCSDPVPSWDQFSLTDPHVHFTYKKIPATVLIKMVETARLERENKSLQQNASDFALSMIPVLGPTLTASADNDPSEVAQATIINALINVVTLPGTPTAQLGGKIVSTIASNIKSKAIVVVDFGKYLGSLSGDVKESVINMVKSRQPVIVKLISEEKYINRITNPFGTSPRTFLGQVEDIASFVPEKAKLPGDQDELITVAHFPKTLADREEILKDGLWNIRGRDTLVFYNTKRYFSVANSGRHEGVEPVFFSIPKKMVGYANGDGIKVGGAAEDALAHVSGGGQGLAIYNKALRTEANATLYDQISQLPIKYNEVTRAVEIRAVDLGIEPVYLQPEFIYNP